MNRRMDFSAGIREPHHSFCWLADPGVNRKLTDIEFRNGKPCPIPASIMRHLPKRLRDSLW